MDSGKIWALKKGSFDIVVPAQGTLDSFILKDETMLVAKT
jgi:hypothetical protein